MKRRLYLEFSHGAWFAVRHVEDYSSGERRIRKRKISLGVRGREKRREAERAVALLEREITGTPAPAALTVADVLTRFLARSRGTVRPVTLGNYERWIHALCAEFGHVAATDLREDITAAFFEGLAARYSPGTVNACLVPLRAAFRWALRSGMISRDPTATLRRMDVPRDATPAYWTPDEFARFLASVHLPRLRCAFGLAFHAGLRAGEIVRLEWRDVLGDRLLVMSRARGRTKTGAQRAVPISPALALLLADAPRQDAHVVAGRHGRAASTQNLSSTFTRMRRAAGMPALTLHGLRHSFATNLALRGVPIHHIQRLLGHADIASTMIYAHPSTDAVLAAVRWAFEDAL